LLAILLPMSITPR